LLGIGYTVNTNLFEEKKMIYTVRLSDDTIGTVDDSTLDGQHPDGFLGEIINVHLHDENGNPIEVEGPLVEVLE
jgi:hypothetical protein